MYNGSPSLRGLCVYEACTTSVCSSSIRHLRTNFVVCLKTWREEQRTTYVQIGGAECDGPDNVSLLIHSIQEYTNKGKNAHVAITYAISNCYCCSNLHDGPYLS